MAYRAITAKICRKILELDDWKVTFFTRDGFVTLNKLGHSQPISFPMDRQLTKKIVRNFCNNAKISEERFDALVDQAQAAE